MVWDGKNLHFIMLIIFIFKSFIALVSVKFHKLNTRSVGCQCSYFIARDIYTMLNSSNFLKFRIKSWSSKWYSRDSSGRCETMKSDLTILAAGWGTRTEFDCVLRAVTSLHYLKNELV